MRDYDHIVVEKKWQKIWETEKTFKTDTKSDKKKFYALDMFPYPSGAGLHVGHPEGYTATDIISRMKRMQGYEVMHPMGWDAFGLPAEQYAIQTGNHPLEFNEKNIANFKKQIKSLGFSYDWDREINTTSADYYKWSQWIFKKLYENDLAELKNMPVNYCPSCGTVLANEEVVDGKCERKGHDVIKKDMQQWVLKITKYADRLLLDLEDLDWPESLKDMQRNWIGKSEGVNVSFKIKNSDKVIEVYTTRVDTLMGVTYVVIAPENELVSEICTDDKKEAIDLFVKDCAGRSELERTELNKDKSGLFTGSYAIHPITNEEVMIFVGDYVLNHYGTGAVMAVACHDQRDYEFAKKYDLKVKQVIKSDVVPFYEDGVLINSGQFDGLSGADARRVIAEFLIENELGSNEVKYKLRDWLFSRQRYWGEPFPIIHLENGETVTVDDADLPVELPMMRDIKPGFDGMSPLKNATEWLNVEVNGVMGIRETNTMPQWAGSCWYYLRYLDPHNSEELVNKEIADKWLPVDLYIGGAEHAVLHLLYARFWHKFLYDIGVVSTKEPFHKLYNQGMILGEGNVKMSKSIGNVINPDDIVLSHGADTLRLYEMFMGPLDASIAWSEEGLDGSKRFIDRVYRLYQNAVIKEEVSLLDKVYNQTVKKVTEDYERLSFNTAISQMMIFVNEATKLNEMSKLQADGFLKLLNPITPHVTEEINGYFNKNELHASQWPSYDESKLVESEFELVVQINGKIKKKVIVNRDLSKQELIIIAKEQLGELLKETNIVKEVAVINKLVNFVVKG